MTVSADTSFLLVGDLQRTMLIERLLGREQNDAERERLVALMAQERAKFVFYLGDLVDVGGATRAWEYFDRLTHPIRETNMKECALYGNHDYFGSADIRDAEMRTRFSNLAHCGHGVVGDAPLALVFVDSNKRELGQGKWQAQLQWLANTLQHIDRDETQRGVVALFHHPPFTNSWIDREHPEANREILPILLQSRKLMLTVTGHSHAYEHFYEHNKHFLVSGGGGGARQELRKGIFRRRNDLFEGGIRRPFHFLRCQPMSSGLRITAVGFDNIRSDVREFDHMEIFYSD